MNKRAGLGERMGAGFRRLGGTIRRHPLRTALALPLALVLYVAAHYPFTPSIGDIRKAKQEQPTVVLSADGKELAVFKRANRDWVKLEDISPKTIDALLATEDHRFYDHHGIDFARTAKAILNTLRGDVEGGSTLTQQLARNLYPEEIGREQTITRKVKEAITALKIEAIYSKDEILETYLNSVSFLYNAWGIERAARTYFDKSAKELNELEAATLVGMLKGTSHYNPVLNPERALERRNTVLALMVKHDKLPEARFERLKEQPLRLDFERLPEFDGMAPHLAQHLKRWLVAWADRHDYNIYADGLVVRTTIDARLQEIANQAVKRQGDALQAVADVEWSRSSGTALGTSTEAYVAQRARVQPFAHFWDRNPGLLNTFIRESGEYQALRDQGVQEEAALEQLKADEEFMRELRQRKTTLQAGFMAMDPQTGQVKAWVGSRDYQEDKFDHVQQARRQPGSTFKPFVYGAAFEMGIPPNETLMDAPVEIRIDRNQVWRPGDVGAGPSNAPMTLREGLARSKNTITAQLMMRVGPSRVAQLARDMGVRESELEAVPALALGTSPVTLKEMVTSFSTIANGGNYIEPVLVTAIEDRSGRVLERFHPPAPEQALEHEAAMQLLDAMRGVIETGTAVGLKHRFGLSGDLAGKTGTTQDNTDGWFILMHPQLVAGAWMGFNDARVRMRSEYWGQGSHNALLVVGDFFQKSSKASLLDAKAGFAAPRMKELDRPLLQQMGDWWNSVFSTPAEPPQEEIAVVEPLPPASLEPPNLEPPPSSLDEAATMLPPLVLPPVPEAPVIVEPQRVPAFPRPLETARPVETVPGTQVYPLPEPPLGGPATAGTSSSGSSDGAGSGRSGAALESSGRSALPGTEFEPRPWRGPGEGGRANPPATSALGAAGDTRPRSSAGGATREGAARTEAAGAAGSRSSSSASPSLGGSSPGSSSPGSSGPGSSSPGSSSPGSSGSGSSSPGDAGSSSFGGPGAGAGSASSGSAGNADAVGAGSGSSAAGSAFGSAAPGAGFAGRASTGNISPVAPGSGSSSLSSGSGSGTPSSSSSSGNSTGLPELAAGLAGGSGSSSEPAGAGRSGGATAAPVGQATGSISATE